MEDLIWYEIFMKDVTNGETDFSLYTTVNGSIPTEDYYYSVNISVQPYGAYEFKYRGVNYIGPGPNSSVTVFSNIVPPNG